MKKVFLDNLPRWGSNGINWKESVGRKVDFIYNDIKGTIEILNFSDKYLTLKYKNTIADMIYSNFKNCQIGILIGEYGEAYKYKIGKIIDDAISGKLEITKKLRIGNSNQKGYEYKCLICDNRDILYETNIKKKRGCNVCSNRKVLRGYNDIHTTSPEFGELLWNSEDGYNYTVNSNKRIDFRCTNCRNRIKNKIIYNIYRNNLSCPKCSDGLSYPNRILYNVLIQTTYKFEFEYSPEWAIKIDHKNKKLNGKKRYDFFIPSINAVIEIHGRQHYTKAWDNSKRNLEEEQDNDTLKKLLASEKGLLYIPIKADISDLEYIKNNILSSKLVKLIDLSNVNWDICEKESQKSLVKVACDYYNEGNISTIEIAKLMNLSRTTITRYLKMGAKLKLCEYDAKKEIVKSGIENGKKNGKPVVRLTLNKTYLDEFESASEAARQFDLYNDSVSNVCRGKQKTVGGYKWMYKEDYEKMLQTT
jgi:predicted transcriptional regulator/ribosomal protein S27E